MNKIISWYNQNRKILWVVILTILAVIGLIQTLNNYYKNNPKEKSSSANNGATTYNTNKHSIITDKSIDEDTANNSSDLIKSFFDYCNSEKIEEAYNMLSADCKEELYPTVDDFKSSYYDRVFTEKKSYDSALWITSSKRNTYRIEIMADLLSSGQIEYMPIEDYYTITYEDGNYKLNISNYIGKEEINVSSTQNNIDITIISKKMYKDYELYEIEIKNNTGSKLIFNTKEDVDSIYIQDENGLKYTAFLNEIPDSELVIDNGITKTVELKFNRGYKPTTDIEKIIFEDISLNNNQIERIEVEL